MAPPRVLLLTLGIAACATYAAPVTVAAPSWVPPLRGDLFAVVLDSVLPSEQFLTLYPLRVAGRTPADSEFFGAIVARSAKHLKQSSAEAADHGIEIRWSDISTERSFADRLLARLYDVEFVGDSSHAVVAFQLVACDRRCATDSLAWLSRRADPAWRVDSITARPLRR